MVDPENKDTSPGARVAPVRVTFAERMLTREAGISVMARTTEDCSAGAMIAIVAVPLKLGCC